MGEILESLKINYGAYDKAGLPVGTYKAMIISEEPDAEGRGVIAEYEVLEGDKKGKTGKVWYLTTHSSPQTANIAKQNLKRIADATGKPVSATSPLKGRVMTIEVREQKKNPDYTEIFRYHAENYVAPTSNDVPFA
jgi:hypothetical protein